MPSSLRKKAAARKKVAKKKVPARKKAAVRKKVPVKKKVAKFLCDARNDAENRSLNVRHLELGFSFF